MKSKSAAAPLVWHGRDVSSLKIENEAKKYFSYIQKAQNLILKCTICFDTAAKVATALTSSKKDEFETNKRTSRNEIC